MVVHRVLTRCSHSPSTIREGRPGEAAAERNVGAYTDCPVWLSPSSIPLQEAIAAMLRFRPLVIVKTGADFDNGVQTRE